MHLIGVIDSDFQPPEYLSLWWMLIHGQLKHVLWAFLSVECRWVIVQVHHSDHHRSHPVVQESAFRTDFGCLDTSGKSFAGSNSVNCHVISCKMYLVFCADVFEPLFIQLMYVLQQNKIKNAIQFTIFQTDGDK